MPDITVTVALSTKTPSPLRLASTHSPKKSLIRQTGPGTGLVSASEHPASPSNPTTKSRAGRRTPLMPGQAAAFGNRPA
ncbi:hypothetical protein [Novosphingobium barchaimii]|nr:hypothetical protein [Novosphingobium barchaimii]